jgi:hypothetical protein
MHSLVYQIKKKESESYEMKLIWVDVSNQTFGHFNFHIQTKGNGLV